VSAAAAFPRLSQTLQDNLNPFGSLELTATNKSTASASMLPWNGMAKLILKQILPEQ
jgi:hypothetical protein